MRAIELESERLIYKRVTLEHLSQNYVDWMNDADVIRYLESGGNYTEKMLKTYLEEVEKKDIYFWAIHLKESQKHIGNIKIDPVNLKHQTAEYGIMMGDKTEWGKGYAKEATLKILDFCFSQVQLRKITLGVILDNVSAYELYNKVGFKVEGILKYQGFYNGKYCDTVRMAIFNPSFYA